MERERIGVRHPAAAMLPEPRSAHYAEPDHRHVTRFADGIARGTMGCTHRAIRECPDTSCRGVRDGAVVSKAEGVPAGPTPQILRVHRWVSSFATNDKGTARRAWRAESHRARCAPVKLFGVIGSVTFCVVGLPAVGEPSATGDGAQDGVALPARAKARAAELSHRVVSFCGHACPIRYCPVTGHIWNFRGAQ